MINIPTAELPVLIDFCPFMREFDKEHKWYHRDFANKFHPVFDEKAEYLDYWHWLLKNCFDPLYRCGVNYLNYKDILEASDTPEWVKKITTALVEDVKGHPAVDEVEGTIAFYIDW